MVCFLLCRNLLRSDDRDKADACLENVLEYLSPAHEDRQFPTLVLPTRSCTISSICGGEQNYKRESGDR
jgi:hypothetical protein